jgi:hypothetical protein
MRQLSRPEDCLSDLTLDEWSTRELDAQEQERVEAHVATCPRCQAQHAELERKREAFYAAASSFEQHAARFVAAPNVRGRSRRVATLAAALAALAAIAVIALRPSGLPSTRSKGAPYIGYFVKRAGRVVPGSTTTSLRPGDLLRFTYSSSREYYLALFNLDSRAASVYFPSARHAVHVPSGSETPLDFSVELDATPGVEHVHALFCEQRFELEPLRAALFASGHLPVPSGCHANSLTLHKVAAP